MYTFTWTVRTGDTDFSGLVYTPTVIDYVAQAMQDLLAEVEFSPRDSHERGLVYPVVHAEADYHEPFGIYDSVTIGLVPSVGDTSMTFDATGDLDGTTVFEASITIACVDVETHESAAVPDDVKRGLAAYA